MNKALEIIYTRAWTTGNIIYLVLFGLMAITTFCVVYFLIRYLVEYRIFESIYAKIKGDIKAYDRIRRSQMRTSVMSKSDIYQTNTKKKDNIIDKIYLLITKTGVTDKIPGFSEASFLIILVVFLSLCFGIVTYLRNAIVGIASVGFLFVIIFYILSLFAYDRKMKLESQLLPFVNACASASLQFSNIIDIFGAIYDQFDYPLREGLEYAYVEAKASGREDIALDKLKDRYDSNQFNFVIDNLYSCSKATGNYHKVSRDIAEPIAIYSAAHKEKVAILKNTRRSILLMFVLSIGIIVGLNLFLSGVFDTLLHTTIGNIIGLGIILVLFYGLNLKTEK